MPPNKPFMLRVPMFAKMKLKEPVGLGDLVTKATKAVGIAPCKGCSRRAQTLNAWVTIGSSTKK
jgi:hypothetical protein